MLPGEGRIFTTDDFENELLGLLELHPVNEEAVTSFARANDKIGYLQGLLNNKLIEKSIFANKKYFKLAETK
ncbi:MAG: hypothetical protein IPH11_02750 [Ignavibacteriales bacterium]|nr:hypothetical protein [Ignavibacteriales bacterium]